MPDAILLWNGDQADEARRLHHVSDERLFVTGAQPWDRWFERAPARDRVSFCRRVGLPDDKPFVLFVGSTASISAPDAEKEFVRRWIRAVRTDPKSADVAVLVRPHPYNSAHWSMDDLVGLTRVSLWPRSGGNPVDEGDRDDYFDSMYYCAAVVGINTSAMIESAIIGRSVLTVKSSEFADTQEGTVHFRYMLHENGGFLRTAASLDAHVRQLAEVLDEPSLAQAETAGFVERFVRPGDRGTARTPIVADVIETIGATRSKPSASGAGYVALRLALEPLVVLATVRGALRRRTLKFQRRTSMPLPLAVRKRISVRREPDPEAIIPQ